MKLQKKTVVSILIHVAVLVALAVAVAWVKGIFGQTEPSQVFRVLSDSFLVPGVVFSGIAGLSWASSKGAYDALRYTFYNFGLHTIWVTKPKKHFATLYEYKTEKDEKGRRWFPHMLYVGLAGIAVAGIFLVLYFAVS